MLLGSSGVSKSALSAGDDSAPETSEKRSGSKVLRGVVKDGLRNGDPGVIDDAMNEFAGCDDSNPPKTLVNVIL